jgi:thiol-disulfide isomerase/thioredoxin
MKKVLLISLIIAVLAVSACKSSNTEVTGKITIETERKSGDKTFLDTGQEICTQDGKPIIRKFATTWCPHCQWIKETYIKVVQEYENNGQIKAYLWEVDIGDNSLTPEVESKVPQNELDVFNKFNKENSIPTFIFGCKYLRGGNGYEQQGNLDAEEEEFRKIIEELISIANN